MARDLTALEREFEIRNRKQKPLMRRRSSRVAMIALAMAGGLVCMGATARRFEPFYYPKSSDLELDMMQKGFVATGFDSDVAILGSGFFKVQMAANQGGGVGFTRYGSLFLDSVGRLSVYTGDNAYPLLPVINMPANAAQLSIAADGTVQYTHGRMGPPIIAGRIQLNVFVNPAGLASQSHQIFRQTAASGEPVECIPAEGGDGSLQSGFLIRQTEPDSSVVNTEFSNTEQPDTGLSASARSGGR